MMVVAGWAVGALGLGGLHWISVDCSYIYARVWVGRHRGWWIVVGVRKLYGGRVVVPTLVLARCRGGMGCLRDGVGFAPGGAGAMAMLWLVG